MTDSTQRETVARILRAHDRDRYFASLLLPDRHRSDVQAVWAFAAEVAAVRERVSEPGPGEIRLQWWNDLLDGKPHGDVEANPVAAALLAALSRHGLPKVPLMRLVAARRFDLYQDPMPDMLSFEGYAGETVSLLYQYAAQILTGSSEELDGDAAGHLGVATALLGHVRAFGYNAAQARLFLPLERFVAAQISEQDIFSGQRPEQVRKVLLGFGEEVDAHLVAAQKGFSKLPRTVRPAFATIGLERARLIRLRKRAIDPYARNPDMADWRKLAAMFIWGLKNG